MVSVIDGASEITRLAFWAKPKRGKNKRIEIILFILQKWFAGKKYRIIAVIPETLLQKFVHQKFWLAGLLTRQTIVAFPSRLRRDSGVYYN